MQGPSHGGNDTLIGGAGSLVNELYGDAYVMEGRSVGGDDTLLGGANSASGNSMYGDALILSGGGVVGGNDRLISAIGSADFMVGDAVEMENGAVGGADTFVFAGEFNDERRFGEQKRDVVYDFRHEDGDKLEIDIDDGVSWQSQVLWAVEGSDVVVTVQSATSNGGITLVGVSSLTESDFLFV
jgi:hypothetical protein